MHDTGLYSVIVGIRHEGVLYCMCVCAMVLKSNGNSEHVAYAWRKIGLCGEDKFINKITILSMDKN